MNDYALENNPPLSLKYSTFFPIASLSINFTHVTPAEWRGKEGAGG